MPSVGVDHRLIVRAHVEGEHTIHRDGTEADSRFGREARAIDRPAIDRPPLVEPDQGQQIAHQPGEALRRGRDNSLGAVS